MRLFIMMLTGLVSILSAQAQISGSNYRWFKDGDLFYRVISEDEGTAGLSLPYNTAENPQILAEAERYLNSQTKIVVPATATDISNNKEYRVISVFNGPLDNREKLESIIFSENILEIDGLHYLPSLTSLQLPSGLQRISGLIHVSSLETLELPQSLRYIADGSISYTGIKNLVIPDGIEFLDVNTLCFNNDLETIEFNGISSPIDQSVMYSDKLSKITLPSTSFSTGWQSFSSLGNLREIWIGNTVSSAPALICSQAFSGLPNLKNIYCPRLTPPEITELNSMNHPVCFDGISNWGAVTLYVPKGCTDIYSKSYCWRDMNIREYDFETHLQEYVPDSDTPVATVAGGIRVTSAQKLTIFDTAGICVTSGNFNEGSIIPLPPGFYIIKTGKQNYKIMVQ